MALKPDRSIVGNQTDISFFYNSTAEKGEVLVFSTGGSGAAMDDATAVVTRPSTNPSGEIFAGVLLNDVVNKDLTQTHINFHKDEMQQGGKVTLARAPAVLVTDMVASGESPTIGQKLSFRLINKSHADRTNRGVFTTTAVSDTGTAYAPESYQIGEALSVKDADGYFKVRLLK